MTKKERALFCVEALEKEYPEALCALNASNELVDKNIERLKAKIVSNKQAIENIKTEIDKQKTLYDQKVDYVKSIKQNIETLQETREMTNY